MASEIRYRSDIDALRALAVCSVVLFHFRPDLLPGGFVGVDVFFVVSGFLITSVIRRSVGSGRFTFGSFYLHRIRRIAPPLIVMLVATTLAACCLLRPFEMNSYGYSLGAQVVSLQNLVFLSEGEYFVGAEFKPLLHTWSLAVEEQFYLIWPLLMLMMRRWRIRHVVALLSLTLVLSFGLNLAAVRVSPKVSFFLLPPRAWELAAGGLVAIARERFPAIVTRRNGIWLLLSLLALGAALLWIDASMPFPGYVALLPVAGTMGVVWFDSSHHGFWKSNPVARATVYVGLLSYSLYLWHWPVLAFARYAGWQASEGVVSAGLLALIVGLTLASYYLVERPVRDKRILAANRRLVGAFAASLALIGLAALHIATSDGVAYRYDPASRALLTAGLHARSARCGYFYRFLHPHTELCQLAGNGNGNGKNILLWGNSHADMWSAMLTDLARQSGTSLYLNAKNCRPVAAPVACQPSLQGRILEEITQRRITDVILASTWFQRTRDGTLESGHLPESELRALVAALVARHVSVWLVVDPPTCAALDPITVYRENPRSPQHGRCPVADYAPYLGWQRSVFADMARDMKGVQLIDAAPLYCPGAYCRNGNDGQVWFRDRSHLTDAGAFAAQRYFRPVFR